MHGEWEHGQSGEFRVRVAEPAVRASRQTEGLYLTDAPIAFAASKRQLGRKVAVRRFLIPHSTP